MLLKSSKSIQKKDKTLNIYIHLKIRKTEERRQHINEDARKIKNKAKDNRMKELIKIGRGINEIVLNHKNERWFFVKIIEIDSVLAFMIQLNTGHNYLKLEIGVLFIIFDK